LLTLSQLPTRCSGGKVAEELATTASMTRHASLFIIAAWLLVIAQGAICHGIAAAVQQQQH
jgi:hypothetical protein